MDRGSNQRGRLNTSTPMWRWYVEGCTAGCCGGGAPMHFLFEGHRRASSSHKPSHSMQHAAATNVLQPMHGAAPCSPHPAPKALNPCAAHPTTLHPSPGTSHSDAQPPTVTCSATLPAMGSTMNPRKAWLMSYRTLTAWMAPVRNSVCGGKGMGRHMSGRKQEQQGGHEQAAKGREPMVRGMHWQMQRVCSTP